MQTKIRKSAIVVSVASAALLFAACRITEHNKGETGKAESVEIKSPFGSLKVNTDVNAKDTGFNVYPGSRPHRESGNDKENSANVNIDSSLFGLKVVVASFESDDPPQKVYDFYKPQMNHFGATLTCKGTGSDGFGNYQGSADDFKCEHGEATDVMAAIAAGGVELKAGNRNDQHIVALKSSGKGTQYAVVHVQVRKRGDSI